MNDPTLIGPCADYEHEIVELQDGALPAERAGIVRGHLEQCARCRAWAAAFAALDARLATELPVPALSPGFDARLRERIAALAAPPSRGELRARLELEHDSVVESLRRFARRRAVLGALGSAALALGLLTTLRQLLAQSAGWLPALGEGPERWVALGGLGAAVAVAALAWSAARNGVAGLAWRR
jgi:anti-sigma factor RsiW